MSPPRQAADEPRRPAGPREQGPLTTSPESALDDLTRLAADICEAPISLVSLVEDRRQVVTSRHGAFADEVARDALFCGHAILGRDLFLVPDASLDSRFADHPLVLLEGGIRFYVAAPLLTEEGHALGVLSVFDHVPRQLTSAQRDSLRVLSRQVIVQLQRRDRPIEPQKSSRQISDSRYRTLFDYAPDGIVIADPQSCYLDANVSICRMLGYTRSELIGMNASDIVVATEVEQIEPALSAIRGDGDYRREWQFRRKDGSVFAADVRATQMADGNLLGMIRDITERKRAESRIRHLNRVYAVLSGINQTIVREQDTQKMLSAACRIAVEAGRFRLAWIGLTDTEGQQFHIAAHAGAAGDTMRLVDGLLGQDVAAGGCVFTAQALHTGDHVVCNDIACDPQAALWRDAALQREYRALAVLPLKKQGRVIGTFNFYADEPGFFNTDELLLLDELATDIGFALDVHARESERSRVDHALRESEERFRELAETIDEAFWIRDPHTGRILYISPAYDVIWGLSRERLYASPGGWIESVHPDDRDRARRTESNRRAEVAYDDEYRILRPDGSIRWIRERAFPVLDTSGQVIRVVGVAKDATDQRQLENELLQSQKMEAIGRLAGGVAHDFNNLLAGILGYSEMLLADLNADDARREDVSHIHTAAISAAGLTRQLLAFSRRQMIEPSLLDVNTVVGDIHAMLTRLIGAVVTVRLDLDADRTPVIADRGQIEQIVLNLSVNARDAMPEGGTLTIETATVELGADYERTHPSVKAGSYVCLSVSDTGSGMSPDVRAHLFEPFYTTKDLGKGTGLGLATVYGIVKHYGGNIDVDTELGRGTSFRLYLPKAVVAGPFPVPSRTLPNLRNGSETILVVDDMPGLRELSRRMLERLGYTVLLAASADEALDCFSRGEQIDVLLTDVVMLGGSGPELTKQLAVSQPTLKVIYMSGYADDSILKRDVLAPGTGFVSKPFTAETLSRKIREALDQ